MIINWGDPLSSPQPKPRRSKYHNKKVEIDGIVFASKSEGKYYVDLQERKKKGEIADFRMQVPVTLQESYPCPATGRKVRPIIYIADFVLEFPDGRTEFHDVKGAKGFMTEIFKLKKKMFEYKFGIPLYIDLVK